MIFNSQKKHNVMMKEDKNILLKQKRDEANIREANLAKKECDIAKR